MAADSLDATRRAHLRAHREAPCSPGCPLCNPRILDHVLEGPGGARPTDAQGWDDRARMAAAKAAAGRALTVLEVEALDRCPHPRRLTLGGWA